jgi:thioredoxin reductase (NADPH)
MLVDNILNCVILGSGPAGYSSAIYAARADLTPILYTGMEPGGKLTTTTIVDNYPGYPEGINGSKLMEKLKEQAKRFHTIIKKQEAVYFEFSNKVGGIHKIKIDDGNIIKTRGLIIATGTTPKYLGLEKRFIGFGVSSCATCDGFLYRDKNVAVIGGGDTAIEETIYLSKICAKVYLLVRRGDFRASKVMQYRISTLSNVETLFHHEIDDILGDKTVKGIRVVNNKTNKKKHFSIEGLFLAIGNTPNTQPFQGKLKMDEKGYILTVSTKTNTQGVFAAGDVQDPIYNQAITSAGTGCMAALDLERYLSIVK